MGGNVAADGFNVGGGSDPGGGPHGALAGGLVGLRLLPGHPVGLRLLRPGLGLLPPLLLVRLRGLLRRRLVSLNLADHLEKSPRLIMWIHKTSWKE